MSAREVTNVMRDEVPGEHRRCRCIVPKLVAGRVSHSVRGNEGHWVTWCYGCAADLAPDDPMFIPPDDGAPAIPVPNATEAPRAARREVGP